MKLKLGTLKRIVKEALLTEAPLDTELKVLFDAFDNDPGVEILEGNVFTLKPCSKEQIEETLEANGYKPSGTEDIWVKGVFQAAVAADEHDAERTITITMSRTP